jgi:hypothetical protein
VRHAQQHPDVARVVALTGTDVYGDLDQPDARASMGLAHRLIVLQPLALRRLPDDTRVKARVIRQSATIVRADAVGTEQGLRVCVLDHLRDVKDPLLAALLRRCEQEPGFLAELRARVLALQPLVDPARERTSWRELVQELGISPTRDVRR